MPDLIQKLRGASLGLNSEDASKYIPRGVSAQTCAEAADRIERLEQQVARLREALEGIRDEMQFPSQLEVGFAHGKPNYKDMANRVEIASSIARQALKGNSMKLDLNELAARVAALTEPDREVDAEIHKTLGWRRYYRDLDYCADYEEGWHRDGEETYGADSHPHYTESLDAALTTRPTGVSINIYHHPVDIHAEVYSNHPSGGMLGEVDCCCIAACAVVAANLRAIIAIEASE